jgi:hypothetical protein
MIKNTLVAFRIPVPMLDKLKDHCDEHDLCRSQVFRRSLAQYFRSAGPHADEPKPLPEPKVKSGWSVGRR